MWTKLSKMITIKNYLMTTQLRILSALHTHEFRHLVHLSIYVDKTHRPVWNAVNKLRELRLIETWKETPTDADRNYKFTKIRLTRLGGEIARICNELERVIDEYETTTDS